MQNIIGKNIANLRKSSGISLENIAKFTDTDPVIIAKIETGEYSPSVDIAEKIASLFGLTTEQLTEQPDIESEMVKELQKHNLNITEIEAITAINRIALNSKFMNSLDQK